MPKLFCPFCGKQDIFNSEYTEIHIYRDVPEKVHFLFCQHCGWCTDIIETLPPREKVIA